MQRVLRFLLFLDMSKNKVSSFTVMVRWWFPDARRALQILFCEGDDPRRGPGQARVLHIYIYICIIF